MVNLFGIHVMVSLPMSKWMKGKGSKKCIFTILIYYTYNLCTHMCMYACMYVCIISLSLSLSFLTRLFRHSVSGFFGGRQGLIKETHHPKN
jgi:hypothetical protein